MKNVGTHAKSKRSASSSDSIAPSCSSMRSSRPAAATASFASAFAGGQESTPTTRSDGQIRHIATDSAATPEPTSRNDASGSSRRRASSSPIAGTMKRRSAPATSTLV